MQSNDPDWRDPEEAWRRCDEAFRRLLRMPPKPQEQMKLGKSRGQTRAKSRSGQSPALKEGGR
jgi:hypothetical protein